MKEKIIFTLLFMVFFVLVSTSQINDLNINLSDKPTKLSKIDSIKEMEKLELFCRRNPEVCNPKMVDFRTINHKFPIQNPPPLPPLISANRRLVNTLPTQLIKNYNYKRNTKK